MTPRATLLGGAWALEGLPSDIERAIRAELTVDNPQHAEAVRLGFAASDVEPTIALYRRDGGVLIVPSGFDVARPCRRHGVELRCDDITEAPEAPLELRGVTLRPYQRRAVSRLARERAGLLVAPTGSGKSLCGLALAVAKGGRTLIVVHTADLVRQWRAVVAGFLGTQAGVIGGGRWDEGDHVTVASVQTLAGAADRLGSYATAIFDEAHHVPARQWFDLLLSLRCRHRFGLSATPERADGLGELLELAFGPARAVVSQREVEAQGGVVPGRVVPVATGLYFGDCDWSTLQAEVAADAERNQIVADVAARAAGKAPTLVLTNRVTHAERLADLLPSATVAHGQLPARARREAFAAIEAGAQLTIGTTSLLGEGLDLPAWTNLILAAPLGSKGPRVPQAVGRVRRPAPGKTCAVVVDLVDEDGRAQGAWRGRRSVYRRLGLQVGRMRDEHLEVIASPSKFEEAVRARA